MIYQVKIDQAVLFTGDTAQVIRFLSDHTRYRREWLMVHGYDIGEQQSWPPYSESASGFMQ